MFSFFKNNIQKFESSFKNNKPEIIIKLSKTKEIKNITDTDFFIKCFTHCLQHNDTKCMEAIYDHLGNNVVVRNAIMSFLTNKTVYSNKQGSEIIIFFMHSDMEEGLAGIGTVPLSCILVMAAIEYGDLDYYIFLTSYIDPSYFPFKIMFEFAERINPDFILHLLKDEPTLESFKEFEPEAYQIFHKKYLIKDRIQNNLNDF